MSLFYYFLLRFTTKFPLRVSNDENCEDLYQRFVCLKFEFLFEAFQMLLNELIGFIIDVLCCKRCVQFKDDDEFVRKCKPDYTWWPEVPLKISTSKSLVKCTSLPYYFVLLFSFSFVRSFDQSQTLSSTSFRVTSFAVLQSQSCHSTVCPVFLLTTFEACFGSVCTKHTDVTFSAAENVFHPQKYLHLS